MAAPDITLRPLVGWPERLTVDRQRYRFDSTYTATKRLLLDEAAKLANNNRYWADVVVHLAIAEADLRRDGQRANARPEHPGVMVVVPEADSFEVHTDRFTSWHDTLRACALAMQALRAVDRYGVANGRQYAGFKQLAAGIPMGPATMTIEEAARFIAEHGLHPIIGDPDSVDRAYRLAAKRLHPDAGGDAVLFARLQDAREVLERRE